MEEQYNDLASIVDELDDAQFVKWLMPSKIGYLSDYSIIIRNESTMTPYWDGQIYRNGNLILHVENSGEGGCNKYVVCSCVKDREDFFEACANAYEGKNASIPEDLACMYLEMREDAKQDSSLALLMA
jgi:hypothetical protein